MTQQDKHGRTADSPMEIPRRGWRDILFRVFHEISDDRTLLIAAGVTYYMTLALVPSLSVFVSLYGLLSDRATVAKHVDLLIGILPAGGIEILQDQLNRLASTPSSALGFALLLSLAIALWSASSGIKALFDAMNIAYDEREKRNFFVLNGLALLFTLGAAVAAALFLSVVVIMPAVFQIFYLGDGYAWLVQAVSYVLMFVIMLVGIGALYRWGPSRQQAKWRWITPGAVLAVVVIILASLLFSWYASHFGNYDKTYGSLGALVGFLTWLWLSITIVLVGAELNSEVEHQTARDSTTGSPRPMGSRGAYMADHVAEVGAHAPADGKASRQTPATVGTAKAVATSRSLDSSVGVAIVAMLVLASYAGSRRRQKPHP